MIVGSEDPSVVGGRDRRGTVIDVELGELLTDELAATAYEVLTDAERAELAVLCGNVKAAATAAR